MKHVTGPLHAVPGRLLLGWVFLFALSAIAPSVDAAPDTPPAQEWVTNTTTTSVNCAHDFNAVASTVDLDGNLFTLEYCGYSATKGHLIVRRFNTNGFLFWTKEIECGSKICLPYGIAADEAGYVGVAFYDNNSTNPTTKTRLWIFRGSDGLVKCEVGGQGAGFPNGWTTNIGIPISNTIGRSLVAYGRGNGTTVYVVGGPSGLEAASQYTSNKCKQLWTSGSVHGDFAMGVNRAKNRLYAVTLAGGAVSTICNVNMTTGASMGSCGTPEATAAYLNKFGPNSTANRLWSVKSSTEIKLVELNATVLNTTRTFTPIESKVREGGALRTTSVSSTNSLWVDGGNSLFACGQYTSSLGQVRWMAAKFNLTGHEGMRWNLTDSPSATIVSHLVDCVVGAQGALWTFGDDTDATAAGTHVFVRKYTNAGLNNAHGSAYTLPGDTIIVPPGTFAPSDFGSGIVAFAVSIGFASAASQFFFGLVLVVILFLVVAGATKGVTDSDRTAGIAGSIAGMGTMIFNTTQLLWPAWTTVVLIILTTSVVLWFTRDLFIQRGGGG